MMDKKVAIVGSGPSGIQAGKTLSDAGFKVTIFDKDELFGGVLRYGIPDFRIPRDATDKKIQNLKNAGIEFKNNVKIGKDISLDELREKFDFVVLATGACIHRELKIPGSELQGVYYALDFLRKYNTGQELNTGKRAVVIGGGYVAIDTVLVLRKLDADVKLVYRRRCEDCSIAKHDIDLAKEQGVEFEFCLSPAEIIGKGKAEKIKFQRNEICEVPGLPKPEIKPTNEFVEYDADSVIIAVGEFPETGCWQKSGLELNEKTKTLKVDSEMETNLENVFACGDLVTGPVNIGSAVKTGIKAAQSIIKKSD